jgi:hypothetical protein
MKFLRMPTVYERAQRELATIDNDIFDAERSLQRAAAQLRYLNARRRHLLDLADIAEQAATGENDGA